MLYTVCFKVDGRFMTMANGSTDEDRREDLGYKASNADFGALVDIDWSTDEAECYEDETEADKNGKADYNLPIEARYNSKVETIFEETMSSIRAKAIEDYENADFGEAEDCECYILWIEDKEGNRIYQNLD